MTVGICAFFEEATQIVVRGHPTGMLLSLGALTRRAEYQFSMQLYAPLRVVVSLSEDHAEHAPDIVLSLFLVKFLSYLSNFVIVCFSLRELRLQLRKHRLCIPFGINSPKTHYFQDLSGNGRAFVGANEATPSQLGY
jgi:hypothetical protein